MHSRPIYDHALRFQHKFRKIELPHHPECAYRRHPLRVQSIAVFSPSNELATSPSKLSSSTCTGIHSLLALSIYLQQKCFGRERRYLRGVNASSEECSRLIQTKREAPLKLDPDNAPAIPSVTVPRSSPSRRNRCKKKFEEKTGEKLEGRATHSSQTYIHRK